MKKQIRQRATPMEERPDACPATSEVAARHAPAADATQLDVRGYTKEDVQRCRESLRLTQTDFARALSVSARLVTAWENGGEISEGHLRTATEFCRLTERLAGLLGDSRKVGEWLKTPNPGFDGLKPLEIIERGQSDRIWRMIYLFGAGYSG